MSGGIPAGGLDRPASTQGQQPQQVQVGLWWPAADPAKLRASAGAWRRLADDVEGVSRVGSQAVLQLSSQNQGEAVSAFEAYWTQRWTGGSGCLPAVAEAARGLSAALDNYAGAVEKAQLRIKELIAAIATAVVIGAALTVVTIGVSDLAAGAVAGSLVAAAAVVGVELSAEAAAIITAGIFATSLGVLEGGLADLAIQGERVGYFHDQPSIDWNEVLVNAAVGGATAGAGFGATTAAPALGRIAARLGSRDAAVVPGSSTRSHTQMEASQVVEERVATDAGGRPNGGLGELIRQPITDPATVGLAKRIGGLPSVKFSNGPPNEFDAVSDKYVAQAKPANFTLNLRFRRQAKVTFQTAIQSGRTPYFQFDGPPGPGVLNVLRRYAARYGVEPVIDNEPFGG